MRVSLPRLIACFALALALAACAGPPAADVVLTERGCDRGELALPADRPPQLLVRNEAAEPMVITLPDISNFAVVEPGQRAALELQPYAWGTFQFFCLTERDHTAVGGAMSGPFVCGIDAYTLRPVALSSGTLTIAQHDRRPPAP